MFGRTVDNADFSEQIEKIFVRYNKIGYNVNVLRPSEYMVVNQIMLDNCVTRFIGSIVVYNLLKVYIHQNFLKKCCPHDYVSLASV